MLRKLLVFLFCVSIFTGTGLGFGIDADSLINKLTREYTGTYQWETLMTRGMFQSHLQR